MWVINIQHWLDETKTAAGVPQLRSKVKKLAEIITYATSTAIGMPTDSIPKCWRRPFCVEGFSYADNRSGPLFISVVVPSKFHARPLSRVSKLKVGPGEGW